MDCVVPVKPDQIQIIINTMNLRFQIFVVGRVSKYYKDYMFNIIQDRGYA